MSGATNLFAVGGGFLYWPDAAAVMGLPFANPSAASFSTATSPYQIVTDGTSVYWTNGGGTTIQSCPVAASCATPTTVVTTSATNAPQLLAADATYVYWTDPNGDIHSHTIAAGGSNVTIATGAVANGQGALAAYGGRVYWTENDGFFGSSIFTCPANAACTPATYYADVSADGLVVDPTTMMLYWTNNIANGTVRKCALGATCASPKNLATGIDTPGVIAIDAKNVLFVAGSTNAIVYAFAK